QVMFGDPASKQFEKRLAMGPAIALAAEVGAHARLQFEKGGGEAGGPAEGGPLPGGQGKNHHVAPVASAEICPERAVDIVPEAAAGTWLERRFPDQTQMARHRKSDVGQAQLYQLASAMQPPVAFGSQD